MLPYWMGMTPADLVGSTAVLAVMITIFSLHFLLPSGRA